MPNPGNFKGRRLAFLNGQADAYANGVKNNQLVDVVADIQQRYLKRFPMSLGPDEEPTQEWLDTVDDSAPEPDIAVPNPECMDHDAFTATMEAYNKLISNTCALKDTIKCCLAYVHGKTRHKDGSVDWTKTKFNDLLSVLAAKLTSAEFKVPRVRTPYNLWGPQHHSWCNPIIEQRIKAGDIPAVQHLAVRSSVYKEQFEQLSSEERELWVQKAKEEHEKALEGLQKMKEKASSHSPKDYQRVISAIPSLIEPILELISEYTGWHWTAFGGGPEPADGGRLNMICIHSGLTAGSRMDFGRSERKAMKKHILPAFGRFTKKCFGKDVCRACALPQSHSMPCLADLPKEEQRDIGLHWFDDQSLPSKKLRAFEVELAKLPKSTPATGTPSPCVKFGPPIGKKTDRLLPTKDNPQSLIPGSQTHAPSPLSQPPITAQPLNTNSDTSNDAGSSSVAPTIIEPVPCVSELVASTPLPAQIDVQPTQTLVPGFDNLDASSSSITTLVQSTGTLEPPPPPGSSFMPEQEHKRSPPPSLPPSPTASRPGSPEVPETPSAPLEPSIPISPPASNAIPTNSSDHNRSSNANDATAHKNSPEPISKARSTTTPSGSATVPRLDENGVTKGNKLPSHSPEPTTKKRKGAPTDQDGSALKKQRLSGPGTAPVAQSFTVTEPANCPEWLSEALLLVTAQDFGPTWRHLVHLWLAIEAKHGFNSNGQRLSSKYRPAKVGAWIKRARNPGFRPKINLTQFEKSYVAWWHAIQPAWRKTNDADTLEPGDGEWVGLDCTGTNGLLSVIAALFFWGYAISTKGAAFDSWDTSLNDAIYVFQQLT